MVKCNQPRAEAEADYTFFQKSITIIVLFMENVHKLFCEMHIDFICVSKNKRTDTQRLHHSKPSKFLRSLA